MDYKSSDLLNLQHESFAGPHAGHNGEVWVFSYQVPNTTSSWDTATIFWQRNWPGLRKLQYTKSEAIQHEGVPGLCPAYCSILKVAFVYQRLNWICDQLTTLTFFFKSSYIPFKSLIIFSGCFLLDSFGSTHFATLWHQSKSQTSAPGSKKRAATNHTL